MGWLSSAGPEIKALVNHCSANFQSILDCSILNFKFKYEDSENIKADLVNTVVFSVHRIKRRAFFFGTPGILGRKLLQKENYHFAKKNKGQSSHLLLCEEDYYLTKKIAVYNVFHRHVPFT